MFVREHSTCEGGEQRGSAPQLSDCSVQVLSCLSECRSVEEKLKGKKSCGSKRREENVIIVVAGESSITFVYLGQFRLATFGLGLEGLGLRITRKVKKKKFSSGFLIQ